MSERSVEEFKAAMATVWKPPFPCTEIDHNNMTPTQKKVARALQAAIPDEEVERLRGIYETREQGKGTLFSFAIDPDTGGFVYYDILHERGQLLDWSWLASYNNTRKTPQEVIDWLERARFSSIE